MKIVGTALAGLVLAATVVVGNAGAAPAQTSATLQIRHQTAGCHSWSANGGPFRVAQTVTLTRGASLTITDGDVMPHQLMRLSGPRVAYTLANAGSTMGGSMLTDALKPPYASGMMPHMGAVLRVTFARAGVYTFRTKAGEDYMKGIKTTGEDNLLKLVVTVR